MEAMIQNKMGFKDTDIGAIPKDWDAVPFGELFAFLSTNSFSRNDLTYEEQENAIYNIHYGDIHSTFTTDVLNLDNIRILPIVKKELDERKLTFLKDGDLVIADVSEDHAGLCECVELKGVGQAKIVSGLHTFAARPNNKLVQLGFSSYVFKSNLVRRELTRIATGTSVTGISKYNLSKLLIPLPTIPEQKKIAEVLFNWDKGIEHTTALIRQLRTRKKGLMQQLLTGKKRLAGYSGKWEEMKLDEYFSERKETGFMDLQLLSVGKEGVYPQDHSVKKDTSNKDKSKYKRICVGDIGYNTMRMWQGRSALSEIEGIVSPAYTIVIPNENADSSYFGYLFKLEEMIHKFYRNSQGMVSDTWMCKFKDFKLVKFNAPPTKEEQTAIASVLKTSDTEIEKLDLYLSYLHLQKKGLIQNLLTGQKRVSTN